MGCHTADVTGRRDINQLRFTLPAGERSDQLEYGAAENDDVLRLDCQAVATGDRSSIDTHYILRGQVDKMPAVRFEEKAGVLTRYRGVHQNNVVIEGAPDGRFAAREHMHQAFFR